MKNDDSKENASDHASCNASRNSTAEDTTEVTNNDAVIEVTSISNNNNVRSSISSSNKRRNDNSHKNRWIIVGIVTGTTVMLTLIIGLIVHAGFRRDICIEEVCHTSACVDAASQILSYINQEVSPCNNFYKFACGKFLRDFEIPPDSGEISTITILDDRLVERLRKVLEEQVNITELKAFQIAKTYYQNCMDVETIEDAGKEELIQLLRDAGGWPVLVDHPSWHRKNLEWYHFLYKFRQMGFPTNMLLRLEVQVDFKNSSFYVLELNRPHFTVPNIFLMDEEENDFLMAYRRLMVDIAVYLGADELHAASELEDALNFEIELAKISLTNENSSSVEDYYQFNTVEELTSLHPTIPWLEYINNMIYPHDRVTIHERILILAPAYISEIEKLLQATPKNAQLNYMMWKAVEAMLPYLNEDLREMHFAFVSTTTGATEMVPRWKHCTREVHHRLPVALGAMYLHNYFEDIILSKVSLILEGVLMQYVDSIDKLDWMDRSTKNNAIRKLDSMKPILGYPEEILEIDIIEEIYNKMDIKLGHYLDSFLNITESLENFKFKGLRLLKSKNSWLLNSNIVAVDAIYLPLLNTIAIPVGLLQGTYFSKDQPTYINYAGVGFAIAHEMTHAFDDTGRYFDGEGKMANWWNTKSNKMYDEKKTCLIEQYETYNITQLDKTVDAMLTFSDNFADNGGIRYAYRAFVNFTEKNGHDGKLPGMAYTTRQLFWISYATNICSKQTIQHLTYRFPTEMHAFPEFRVNGPLRNMEEFVGDFDCPEESEMFSKTKCTIL